MTIRTTTATIAAIAMLAVGACAKKAPEELPPPPAGTDTPTDSGISNAPIPGSQQDFIANVSSDRIFFDFDQYNVDAQDQATLQSQAQWLQRNPAVRVTLEGHADERGTRDYNIALGERRANAAKNYLASLGIDPSRINVISYGKERPAALGSNEEAWAQNRRAVTVVIER
ncbi:peptidoglycan-associated lipoprotein Pal [Sphingopyxis indica]|uniref:Peptidoglycan-associated lipoprotein n=1 Tax=Sphingopyxis indica TaxID=436663 RepID=A0A239L657_9SPHN|nr:peptidoglycan-associated lipoprotein Pal [Sphingopyxis indica]WOF42623.1 peptidoglycan-associated lipoprotein Pal [Sphingopyxis indica]SNT25159.1 peptidoglycan-associated lipoprotein [Sphingopyxis indica]